MGSKKKFWYRSAARHRTHWLFKYPKPDTREHWAEKIAAELAAILGTRHAAVELAIVKSERGSTTRSFVVDGLELVHGNQILKASVPGYNPEKKFGQADHTLDNALTALDGIFTLDTAKHKAKSYFAEYLVLDAVIGNTDRHHENWGMLRQRHDLEWLQFLAPSFDHASSLGRELVDDRRASLLKRDRIGLTTMPLTGEVNSTSATTSKRDEAPSIGRPRTTVVPAHLSWCDAQRAPIRTYYGRH